MYSQWLVRVTADIICLLLLCDFQTPGCNFWQSGWPTQQQWQNLPMSSGFPVSHSKMAAESASWEDLAAAVKGAGKSVTLL